MNFLHHGQCRGILTNLSLYRGVARNILAVRQLLRHNDPGRTSHSAIESFVIKIGEKLHNSDLTIAHGLTVVLVCHACCAWCRRKAVNNADLKSHSSTGLVLFVE